MHEPVMRSRIHALAAIALVGCNGPVFARRPQLVLAAAKEVAESYHGAWLELIYREACARIGLELVLVPYPARRASSVSDAGLVDGEINRVRSYGALHPEMIRIDPPHFAMHFSVYGHASQRVGKGWDGLSESRTARIDFRNGVVRCHEMLGARIPPSRLAAVDNATLGIRKLAQRRSDLYVDLEFVVERVLLQPEFAQARIRKLAVVEKADMHCYLHPSKRELAVPLSSALAAMHREGQVERMRLATLARAGTGRAPG